MNNNTQCDVECYDDADCRGDNKCCSNGCGQVCFAPTSPYDHEREISTPKPYYPEQQVPQEPQVPGPVVLEEKTGEELNVVQPEGDVATLRCYATGYPLPTVSWRRGSVVVCTIQKQFCINCAESECFHLDFWFLFQINTNQGRFVLTSSGDLQIVQVHKTDSGTYVCVANNGFGEPIEREVQLEIAGKCHLQRALFSLLVYGIQYFVIIKFSKAFSIFAHCNVTLRISSFFIALLNLITSIFFFILLLLRFICSKKLHVWWLVLRNDLKKTRFITDPSPSKAYILGETNSSKIVEFNRPAALRCLAGGYPKPSVTWWKDTNILPLKTTHFEVNRDYSLVFNSIRLSDLGPYICQAYSGQGRPVSMYVTLMAIGSVQAETPEDEKYLQYVIPAPPLQQTPNYYRPTPPPVEVEPSGKYKIHK